MLCEGKRYVDILCLKHAIFVKHAGVRLFLEKMLPEMNCDATMDEFAFKVQVTQCSGVSSKSNIWRKACASGLCTCEAAFVVSLYILSMFPGGAHACVHCDEKDPRHPIGCGQPRRAKK